MCGSSGYDDSDVGSLNTTIVEGPIERHKHAKLHARQATETLAHMVAKAWIGPKW